MISREAAKITENFVFTVGVGDDFVMRLGVDSIENFRTGIMQTLHASKWPKVRLQNLIVALISLLFIPSILLITVQDIIERFRLCPIRRTCWRFRIGLERRDGNTAG